MRNQDKNFLPGDTCTVNGHGDLAMDSEARSFIREYCRIVKTTKSGLIQVCLQRDAKRQISVPLSNVDPMTNDEISYRRGEYLAWQWVSSGGNLNAESPGTRDEAFDNGFCDYLAEARRERDNPRPPIDLSDWKLEEVKDCPALHGLDVEAEITAALIKEITNQ